MDNSLSNEAKKINLEELSKEDLVKKCRGLLTIAQKAKQTKDILQDENNKLKQELAGKSSSANDVSQEIIEKLTQQKLNFVTTIEELKAKNSSLDSKLQIFEKELEICQEKLYTTDNENVSYKRQVTRLTEENEQLLTHLESLEKQIDELNKVGIQQREQLLELEVKANESKSCGEDKVIELQCMLSVSLEEVKKLKTENLDLNERIENLQLNLSEKDKNIVVISQELEAKCDILNNIREELVTLKKAKEIADDLLKENREENEKLKHKCEELDNVVQVFKIKNQELQDLNSNQKSRLKLYHSKIIKFAGNAKALREEKNRILHLFKIYTDQVNEWKEQLQNAGQRLIVHVNSIELENKQLKQNVEKSDFMCMESNEIMKKKYDMEEIKETLKSYEHQLEIMKIEKEKENDCLNKQLKEVEHKYNELKGVEQSLNDYKNKIETLNKQKEMFEEKLYLEENKTAELMKEIALLKQHEESINSELLAEKQTNINISDELKLLIKENANIKSLLEEFEKKCLDLNGEIECLMISNKEAKNEINLLLTEKKSVNIIVKEKESYYQNIVKEAQSKILDLEKQIENYKIQISSHENDRQHVEATEKELAERSCLEIKKLAQENAELIALNNVLQEKLQELECKRLNVFHCECQTDEELLPINESDEQIANLKRENTELLSEMTEMNEAIKERGETISRLEVHCDEIMKKLQIYETQANKNVDSLTQKEEIIKRLTQEIETLKSNKQYDLNTSVDKDDEINSLRTEIENLKEKLNSNFESTYAESETMSTSTISRTEDANRLKDLEGSWEEKYGKLRNLAVKLKGKVRELTNTVSKEQNEKDDLQKKLTANLKAIQLLQNQSDKFEDELEGAKKECNQYLSRLNTIAEDISKDKQLLVSKDDLISELKREIENLKSEKQSTDNWKKQVSAKVQTLRKELELNNTLKKELEGKVLKLTVDLEEREKALKSEIENHKQTKNLLDLSNNECKKHSVLSLEMQDYERSVKETSKKLEKQQEQITSLKGQVDSHKTTISALREQNKLLEERVQEVETDLNASIIEIATYKKKAAQLDEEIQQKEDKIQTMNQLLETSRSENEELSTELSKVIAEHQKTNNILKGERDHLRSQTMGLQQNLREVQDTLKLKEEELEAILKEYDGYKVRAQSVLRQSQSRDVGMEEKISEEMAVLKLENIKLKSELNKNMEKLKELEETNEKLLSEKEDGYKKIQEFGAEIEELKSQYAQLSVKHQKCLLEHAETIRSLKLHADTLSQCYRQQLTEQETRHNREIIELQNQIEKVPSPVDTHLVPPTMTREEGEGSESIESNNTPNVHPMPLERLLNSSTDEDVINMRKQLNEQESKLAHLTALLSDTEQDLAKHVQMNTLLKEEIRRQQRSLEREKHAENLEYLKNVVLKFSTLNSGDEKSRLVPVLNTILKLSPEETNKLNVVAKGDTGIKGWTTYLPTWSSTNKP